MTVPVVVSSAQARQKFHGCDPDYIRDVCHAACCRSSSSPLGFVCFLADGERGALEARGARVRSDSLLLPRAGEKKCPFIGPTHLCTLHGTPHKPIGCIASPFTLSPSGKRLVVANRYRLLRCYKDGANPIPAYRAFFQSLVALFGPTEAERIRVTLDSGSGDFEAQMLDRSFAAVMGKKSASKKEVSGGAG